MNRKNYLLFFVLLLPAICVTWIISEAICQNTGKSCSSTALSPANNTRGRVTLDNGTIVTDRGTLLRGCRVSTDLSERLPGRAYITAIKQYGLNTIHLYAESFVKHQPGQLCALVDSMVAWTRQDSLYLVLTIGCIDQNGDYDYDFTMGFWTFYAPRYAGQTHVIYEIHNEPFAWTPPYPDSTLNMERDAYNLIRLFAPQTHVLLFSYASPTNSAGMLRDIRKLGDDIDWSNCSVATHGYNVSESELETVLSDVQNAGYSIINTEPCYLELTKDYSISTFRQQIRVHENNHVSYLHFHDVVQLHDPAYFKNIIENAGLSWTPDFGIWPPPLLRDPYSRMDAEYFNRQGGPSGVTDWGNRIGYVSNGDYVMYDSVDFGQGATEFQVYTASGGIGGTVEIRLDSTTGVLVGQVDIAPTGSWDTWVTKTCSVTSATGMHNLVLKFTGGEWDLFDIDWFQFTSIPTTVHSAFANFKLPHTTGLEQNYPNPFNATTVIPYFLQKDGYVTLTIYNIQGQCVTTLYEGYQTAGEHRLNWAADRLPGGIYFCKLRAGSLTTVRKLILQK